MTDSTAPTNVREYLADLEGAMAGLPEDTSRDIIGAIREELYGLDAASAATRIRRFGDPQFIASEARAAGSTAATAVDDDAVPPRDDNPTPPASPAFPTSPAAIAQRSEPNWFGVVAALLVMFGSIPLPVIGTIAGLGMVWLSAAWSRKEKVIATLIPVALVAIIAIVSALTSWIGTPTGSTTNPFMPSSFDLWHSGILLVIISPIPIGIWLLKRQLRTWSPTGRTGIAPRREGRIHD